jgi:asparagine synthase (glutamine-hydrolysing)
VSAVSSDREFSEEPFIDAVGRHLNAPIHKISLDLLPDSVFDLLDTVIWHNDQPISGLSTVAHYLLMQRAKALGVTVLLSGQGGDEVLCGYRKYVGFYLQDLARRWQWAAAIGVLAGFARRRSILPQVTMRDARRYLPGGRSGSKSNGRGERINLGLGDGDLTARQVLDLNRLTVPSLVHYEDRMSMAFAREIRLPFLDYRLADAMVAQPPTVKLHDGWTKWIFRRAMAPDLPPDVAWRRDKQGFLNPQRKWLKQDLAGRIRGIFSKEMYAADLGLIDQAALRRLYDDYVAEDVRRGRVHDRDVFGPLALEVWLRRYEAHIAH